MERRDQQHEAAAKLLDQAQAALPKDHYSLQTQLHSARCALLLEQEDFGPAEHHCALAFKRLRHSNGAQSGIVWYALAERARALAGLGDFAAAHKALDRAAKKMRELLGPDAYQNALIADRQGDVLRMQNLPARAAELYRESERLAHLNYGPDHWQRYSAALSRAECLALNAQTRAQATVIVDDLWRRFASIEQVRRKPFRLASLSCSLFQQSDQENRARALVQ